MLVRKHTILAVLFSLSCLAGCGGDDSEPVATVVVPPTSAEVLAAGAYGVGVTTVIFTDTSRETMPNRGQAGSPSRRLVTEIWYPAAKVANQPAEGQRNAEFDGSGGPYPLIIYSHGFSDLRIGGAYVGKHLASHGYIVAAADFPLTNFNTLGGPNGADLVNQPGDVSFLIDSLLAGGEQNRFAGAVDEDRIGLAGLSFGGATTSLATFHRDLGDPRVRAAATLAGGGCNFSEKFYSFASVPLLILHGDIDGIVPYPENGVYGYGIARAPKYFLTVKGGSHTAFSEIAAALLDLVDNPDAQACIALSGGSSASDSGEGVGFPDIGGEDVGIIDGTCGRACVGPYPRSIRPPRQRQLALLGILPFFEAHLRGRADMRAFLEHRLAAENTDATVEFVE